MTAARIQTSTRQEPNQWAVLALVACAQLMVVLDSTVVNIALPSAQRVLHFSTDNRQWIITAYALAFGSLLLLGGKLGDVFGRKWTLIVGLAGFSIASVIGGLAQSFGMLVAARALQGVFGALLSPAALSLLTVTFMGTEQRAKAFGVFGAIVVSGGSLGLVLGGALTQILSWRWCLYINLAIALPLAVVAWRLLANQPHRDRPRIDLPGVLTASFGLFALVYGFSNAETHSWSAILTIVSLAASAVLLISFVVIEGRTNAPLLPLHIVWDRARGGSYALTALIFASGFGVFLFLTYYMQRTLGFSPLTAGLAFLPMTAMIGASSMIVQTRLLPRFGVKPLVIAGTVLGIIGMFLFTRLTPNGTYAAQALPGLIITGIALGTTFAPCLGTATLGVDRQEAGIASAMVNTSQQVGGSIGAALLSTLFASAAANYLTDHHRSAGLANAAAVHGYTTAFWWAAGLFAVALLVALLIIPSAGKPRARANPAPNNRAVGEPSVETA